MNKTLKSVLIALGGAALMAVVSLGGQRIDEARKEKKEAEMPKYVIMLIGDGLSFNSLAMTENYLSYKDGDKKSYKTLEMRKFPHFAMVSTSCDNNIVTCSAAAATAISTGFKTRMDYEGMDPEGNELENIAEKLHKIGYNIGIITDEPLNHATPVAFYGHHKSRNRYGVFSRQLAESGFEVFAGDAFIEDRRDASTGFDPIENVRGHGYEVVYSAEDFRALKPGQKACLFQPSSRESASSITAEADSLKTYDIEEDAQGDFTIKEMLELTIERLGDKEPFFIMCEGGDIDHAAHANFAMCQINEIIKFDAAVASAVDFYEKHPDETLVIVTSDHETGGIAVGAPKHKGKDNWVNWEILEADWEANKSRGFEETEFNHDLSWQANIGYSSVHHTAGMVPVFALGKHSERFQTAMDNTEFVKKIME